jgi:hypothetical protein
MVKFAVVDVSGWNASGCESSVAWERFVDLAMIVEKHNGDHVRKITTAC